MDLDAEYLAPDCFKGFDLTEDFGLDIYPPYNNNVVDIAVTDCGPDN